MFLCFKPPNFKSVVKANVFLRNFIDQTFHVVEWVKTRAPENLLTPLWGDMS